MSNQFSEKNTQKSLLSDTIFSAYVNLTVSTSLVSYLKVQYSGLELDDYTKYLSIFQ